MINWFYSTIIDGSAHKQMFVLFGLAGIVRDGMSNGK